MNTIYLMGGLGNQLFQIFALLSYCLQYKKPFKFLYSETLKTGIERPTYWNSVFKRLKNFTTTDISIYKNKLYKEEKFSYTMLYEKNEPIMLYGYFQSYKYFEKHYEQIIKLLNIQELKQQIFIENKELLDIKNTLLVSLHFRLGDYKEKQAYHPVMSIEYYINSIKHIIENGENSNIKILYFCEENDNEIVNNNILQIKKSIENNSIEFIKVNDNIEDWKQMIIMSLCHHNIIANSSFSWWGAYFNSNQEKIVCYPSIWFGEASKDKDNVQDLFKNNWIKITPFINKI